MTGPGRDSVTESSIKVAKVAAANFGGEVRVNRYYDQGKVNSIDILDCIDRPVPSLTTYSTVTLHGTVNLLEGADVRVELLGVAASSASRFPNMLCHAALCVIKQYWLCAPGVIFPGLLTEYSLSNTLPHLMWISPILWDELGEAEIFPDLRVYWLMALPISDEEREFVAENGFNEFEKVLEDADVEYYDLGRRSLV